ncbi:hypothetical protein Tco_1187805 [Tanacetum coccineum]
MYNNLRVFEQEIQGSPKPSSSAQNVAFVSQSKSSNNKVKSSFSEDLDLLHEDLEQIDDVDIEEMDINWQIGEHTEAEESNHALMAISSSNEVIKKYKYLSIVKLQKQQLSLNEKLTFQANEIYEKDEKLKKYRRIGMKAVKEKEQLQKTLDSCKDSSKNLWRLIDSGMSSNSKVGLGFEIQSVTSENF